MNKVAPGNFKVLLMEGGGQNLRASPFNRDTFIQIYFPTNMYNTVEAAWDKD